jgi:hypothetical protein
MYLRESLWAIPHRHISRDLALPVNCMCLIWLRAYVGRSSKGVNRGVGFIELRRLVLSNKSGFGDWGKGIEGIKVVPSPLRRSNRSMRILLKPKDYGSSILSVRSTCWSYPSRKPSRRGLKGLGVAGRLRNCFVRSHYHDVSDRFIPPRCISVKPPVANKSISF